jgi:hypothetical protein
MLQVKKITVAAAAVLLVACGKPKPQVPSLTPQQAAALLQFDNKAHNWMDFVKRNNTGCEYKLDLPDQSNQPEEIDVDHIVSCGGRPAPKEFDASVVFVYDKAEQHWIVKRFSS